MSATRLEFTLLALSALCAACQSTSDVRQSATDAPGMSASFEEMDMEEMMAGMMAFATPTDGHNELATHAGSWNVATRWRMYPGAEWEAGTATSNSRMIMGGRYLEEVFESDYEGMPFEGRLIMGYNNGLQRYESIWFDSMGTGMSYSQGEEIRPGFVELHGHAKDFKDPGGRPIRMTSETHDPNHITFTMFDTLPDGTEFETMTMEYTR